jgi:hypothetical protein
LLSQVSLRHSQYLNEKAVFIAPVMLREIE